MSCLGRLIIAGAVIVQIATFALTLAVIWSAAVLGEAAIIGADDAMILFFLNIAGLAGTLVIAAALWLGGRARRRQARALTALESPTVAGSSVSIRSMTPT